DRHGRVPASQEEGPYRGPPAEASGQGPRRPPQGQRNRSRPRGTGADGSSARQESEIRSAKGVGSRGNGTPATWEGSHGAEENHLPDATSTWPEPSPTAPRGRRNTGGRAGGYRDLAGPPVDHLRRQRHPVRGRAAGLPRPW